MAKEPSSTVPRHPRISIQTHEALMRLLRIAGSDTGQARVVADFLLAWWNPTANGRFDFVDLWSVDQEIEEDILLLLSVAVKLREYPDTLGYSEEFQQLVGEWRGTRADR